SSPTVSRREAFVVTRPSTTSFPSGIERRGAKVPDRSSSYSSSSRSARMRGKIRSASQSYPPSTSQRLAWFPRQRWKPKVTFGIPEVGVEARARKRHLDHTVGAPAHVGELLGRQRPFPSKLPDHRKRRPLDAHLAELAALPIAPEERVEVPVAEAVDGRRELT